MQYFVAAEMTYLVLHGTIAKLTQEDRLVEVRSAHE